MSENYYDKSLNAQKLYQVYQTKYLRVRQYFESEIAFVREHLQGTEHILELGAGYGRIMKELAPSCQTITGIDISQGNVDFGREYLRDLTGARLLVMDAHDLRFEDTFDVVLCLQNALSAMKTQPAHYIHKITALLSPGGRAFISSYSSKFWEHRLAWFHEQADKGLLGEIDVEKTKDGAIVCKDGFRATTHSPEDMDEIGNASGHKYKVTEVDDSSVFLVITKQFQVDE
ncbi:MAG: class I SAM-dependent methyltransferase [Oscillospiraceae bacterium]|nr:class I SAM-dependent methyltransferase [Oscillospiraceae bacterium]